MENNKELKQYKYKGSDVRRPHTLAYMYLMKLIQYGLQEITSIVHF